MCVERAVGSSCRTDEAPQLNRVKSFRLVRMTQMTLCDPDGVCSISEVSFCVAENPKECQ